jgi:hypothetical protein
VKKSAARDRYAGRSGIARCVPILAILSLTALFPEPARAENPAGFVSDIDGRCALWAPSMLATRDYAVRYDGACRSDRAEGRGRAEWLYRYSEMKVKARWEGEFRNGVFLDGQAIEGWVEPLAGDRYIVAMGKVEDARLVFISRGPQDGPMVLCRIDRVGLVLAPNADAGKDDEVRRLMRGAARVYLTACPDGTRAPEIGVYAEAVAARPNGLLPAPIAFARYDAESGTLTAYRNDVSDAAYKTRKDAEFARAQDEVRKRFDEFSEKNRVAAWVTTRQLDENPFRWEGVTVGLVVRLERMLARDVALVSSGLRDPGRRVQLTGVTPDFPDSRHAVLVAAEVGARQPAVDGSDAATAYTTLRRVDSHVCEDAYCGDWFIWARGARRPTWGEAFTPR